jgi:hypothetical protein
MSDYFDRVERQIVQRVEAGVPHTSRLRIASGHLAVAATVLVVIAVAGVFLLARGADSSHPSAPVTAAQGLNLSFAPEALPGGPGAGGTLNRTVQILRARLHQAVPGAQVSARGGRIVVHVSNPGRNAQAQILALVASGRLEIYDWETSAVAPNGKTVARQLQTHNPTALTISQGSSTAAPGDPGAGCLSLDEALSLAAKQPLSARAILVQAIGQGADYPPGYQDPAAGYYVLRDDPSLSRSDITDPRETTLPGGEAGVSFKFTASGRREFQVLTAAIARRGRLVSGLGETLNQHFAIAIDDKLVTVPSIDYKQYPDGINANAGADIAGGLTKQSAKDLAILLRYGTLPLNLTATG